MSVESIVGKEPPSDGRQWQCFCARCGSTADPIECEQCGGEGVYGHDCGEDSCCCLHPEDNVACDVCHGHGGWLECISSVAYCDGNPLSGREHLKRGEFEWVTTESKPTPQHA